ncbi:MAG: bifunctional oligoribonuclease/PAP phosphatase NrnA [Anaerolineae bacterium]|nr:MAG: bifunctional oligoribonuclease/PAP phosphatase NrnA [Anaerolineae bacterium]
MNKALLNEARALLGAAQRILVAGHVRPDGDAIGSVLGLGMALEAQGKAVQMVLADGVSSSMKFIPGSDRIVTKASGEFDLVVALDTGDLERLGTAIPAGRAIDLNIDHHPTNTLYGRLNLVDPQAAAVAEILAQHLPDLGLAFTPEVRAALLTGLLTDTIGFRTPNTRPGTLRLAADLLEGGAPLAHLYFEALTKRTFSSVRLWGQALGKVKLADGIVWATISREDARAAGYSGRDDADLVNWLASVAESEIALVLVQQDDETVKVSWRAEDGADVAQVAVQFGGGGHVAASGAVVKGNLLEVEERVLKATAAILTERLQNPNTESL